MNQKGFFFCSYLWYHNSVLSLSGWAVTYKLIKKSWIPVAHMKLNAIKHLKVWNCCFCLSKHLYLHTQTINWEPSCKASFQISRLVNKSHFFMPDKSIPLVIHSAHERWPAAATMGQRGHWNRPEQNEYKPQNKLCSSHKLAHQFCALGLKCSEHLSGTFRTGLSAKL